MGKVCQVTGKRPRAGRSVSFSNRRSGRWFRPNVQRKRYWVPSERRWVTLTVSTTAMRTIDKRGIDAVVADLRRNGMKL